MKTTTILTTLILTATLLQAADPIQVRFQETPDLFPNPGQGWLCGPGNQPTRFPCSVVYFRFDWVDVEPEEGHFNWNFIDSRIAAAKAKGQTVAFRVMTANAHSKGFYTSPKWLFDAGCKGYETSAGGDGYTGGKPMPRIEPDYADPVYLTKHANFLRELGKRYDGNPDVEFLDIGSYGIWGEWHTPHPVSWDVRRQILDMYFSAFHKTPLATMSDDAEAMAYTLPRGAGYRRDGVGSPWHEQNWIGSPKYKQVPGFADAWKTRPVIFEWYGDYAYMEQKGWSFDKAIDFLLNNHVTLLNDNIGKVPESAMPKLQELARRAGYRFVLRDVTHQPTVHPGAKLKVEMNWTNTGVNRLLRPYPLELYLLDVKGATVRVSDLPTTWLPGNKTVTAELPIPPGTKPGTYTLALAIVDADGKPAIQLAIDAPQTNRLYRISKVTVD